MHATKFGLKMLGLKKGFFFFMKYGVRFAKKAVKHFIATMMWN